MKTKMKVLSMAVGAALGASVTSAQADDLLFPFFESGNGIFTFLSLRSDAGGFFGGLHYTWQYRPAGASGACIHSNRNGFLTAADLVQHTVVDPSQPQFGGLEVHGAFGDASTPRYLLVGGTTQGFVIVQDDSAEGAFGGQAIVINTQDDRFFAYKALNDPANNSGNTFGVDFNSILVSHLSHDLTWYPVAPIVDTEWYALVTGTDMDTATAGGWAGTATLSQAAFGGVVTGVFDRDEDFISGFGAVPVTCFGFFDRNDFLDTNQEISTRGGGWAWLVNTGLTNNATGTLVYKFESSDLLGQPITVVSAENAFPNFPY